MIGLTKLNGKEILVNSDQIEYIETIPESKIVMMNNEYLLVKESKDTILKRIIEYKKRCSSMEEDIVRKNLTPIEVDDSGEVVR